jgi:hypothetical protein
MMEMALAESLQWPLEQVWEQAQQRVMDDADMFVVAVKLEVQPEGYLVGQTDKAQQE